MLLKLCKILLSWVLLLVVLIVVTLPLIILCIIRFLVVIILRKIRNHDFVSPISKLDFGFCVDNFWESPMGAIGGVNLLKNPICIKTVTDLAEKILSPTIEGTTTEYDRLVSLYPSFWLGFPFWRKVKAGTFKIERHIRIYYQPLDEKNEKLEDILKTWLSSKFIQDQPLWDILILPEYRDNDGQTRGILAFRIHHIVGDGYSILSFLKESFTPLHPSPFLTKESYPIEMKPITIFQKVQLLMSIPNGIWNHVSPFLFHTDYFDTVKINTETSLKTISVKLNDLKEIRRRLSAKLKIRVSLPSAILFLLRMTFKKAFTLQIITNGKGGKEFKNMKVVIALPKLTSTPPNKFCNHWTHVFHEIPMEGHDDEEELKKVTKKLESKRKVIDLNEILMNFHSLMPRCAYSFLQNQSRGTTIGMVNLPGKQEVMALSGNELINSYALVGLQLKNGSFTLGCYSYLDKMNLTFLANQSLFSDEVLQKICHLFETEMELYLEYREDRMEIE